MLRQKNKNSNVNNANETSWRQHFPPDAQAEETPRHSREELRRLNAKHLLRNEREKLEEKRRQKAQQKPVDEAAAAGSGAIGGIFTFIYGLSSTCGPAIPLLKILAGAIVLGAVVYGISRLLF